MDGKPGFGLNDPNLKSWGKFNLSNLDGVVVHPDGVVIAVSWQDSKLEILQISEAPSDDNKAEDAQMVSGLGVRQGLLNGPRALVVTPDGRTDITYFDVAVEAKGYIYVLSYVSGGSVTSNYSMDIYNPDGSFLVRTPNSRLQPTGPQYISAAKFVIDVWRSVYTLNYEAIVGPNNRTEPSISHWTPTPPLFDLPLEKQPNFDNHNVTAVRADFAANGVTLSASTRIETVSESGFWYVIDGAKTYDVIRRGSSLQVYSIPAS